MSRLSVSQSDIDFQNKILAEVSRTFALTIPKLPDNLVVAVSNAYLLCRIADTIEDDPDLSFSEKKRYSDWFAQILRERSSATEFSAELLTKLGPETSQAERSLIKETSKVLRVTHSLSIAQREAMLECVDTMTEGMVLYQNKETLNGLENQSAMDLYCYYVAGIVGVMLTKIFLDYGTDWDSTKKVTMEKLSVSFGQGLQMTNILKDIWTDRERGACWVPRDLFEKENIALAKIKDGRALGFQRCLETLIGTSLAHLGNALDYTLCIPKRESGIRLFCLWALFMAVLTLKKIHKDPRYLEGETVKISRLTVKFVMTTTTLLSKTNLGLRALFYLLSLQMPRAKKLVTAISSRN